MLLLRKLLRSLTNWFNCTTRPITHSLWLAGAVAFSLRRHIRLPRKRCIISLNQFVERTSDMGDNQQRNKCKFANTTKPISSEGEYPVSGAQLERTRSLGSFEGVIGKSKLEVPSAVEQITGHISISPSGKLTGTKIATRKTEKETPSDEAETSIRAELRGNYLEPSSPSLQSFPADRTLGEEALSLLNKALDDNNIQQEPLSRVDYFSYDWNKEEIAGSWRYVVTRKQDLANSARLENASWRMWTKSMYNLKTVPPSTVNWLKEYDVTWLYGPLYHTEHESDSDLASQKMTTPPAANDRMVSESQRSANSRTTKSILKKKTAAELMLGDVPDIGDYLRHHKYRHEPAGLKRQLMASLLNKQYTRSNTTGNLATSIDKPSASVTSFGSSNRKLSAFSISSAGTSNSERHVHFSDRVEQCVAVDPSDEPVPEHPGVAIFNDSDASDFESEDDGGCLFLGIRRQKLDESDDSGTHIIAHLPATTLNYQHKEAERDQETLRTLNCLRQKSPGQQSSVKNYDYGSVFSSTHSRYQIVDPSVKAVEIPEPIVETPLNVAIAVTPRSGSLAAIDEANLPLPLPYSPLMDPLCEKHQPRSPNAGSEQPLTPSCSPKQMQ